MAMLSRGRALAKRNRRSAYSSALMPGVTIHGISCGPRSLLSIPVLLTLS